MARLMVHLHLWEVSYYALLLCNVVKVVVGKLHIRLDVILHVHVHNTATFCSFIIFSYFIWIIHNGIVSWPLIWGGMSIICLNIQSLNRTTGVQLYFINQVFYSTTIVYMLQWDYHHFTWFLSNLFFWLFIYSRNHYLLQFLISLSPVLPLYTRDGIVNLVWCVLLRLPRSVWEEGHRSAWLLCVTVGWVCGGEGGGELSGGHCERRVIHWGYLSSVGY